MLAVTAQAKAVEASTHSSTPDTLMEVVAYTRRDSSEAIILAMTLQLSLASAGQYLKPFSVELNSGLTIVTGINGSGKSSLLNEIANGSVKVNLDGEYVPIRRILHFNVENFTAYQTVQIHNQGMYENHDNHRYGYHPDHLMHGSFDREKVINWIKESFSILEREFSNELISAIDAGDITGVLQNLPNIQIKNYQSSITQALKSFYDIQVTQEMNRIAKRDNREVIEVADPFDVESMLNSILDSLNLNYKVYNGEEYKKYMIDQKYRSMGAQIINNPEQDQLYQSENFDIRLINNANGSIISISMLSSGEKSLLNIASIIATEIQQDAQSKRPVLLIFDEPDAHLHPDYSRLLISLFVNDFIEKYGFKIIMSTHSPITLSVADVEDTLLVVDGTLSLVKSELALNKLMSGISHIDVLNRKNIFIFVESYRDASIYSNIYSLISRRISYEYSPIFLPSSHADGGGNCALVQHLIKNLPKERVFHGIIDWDLINEPDDRLHVLSYGERYAIENIIFDPLVITTLLVSRGIELSFLSSLPKNISTTEYLENIELQQLVTGEWVSFILECDNSDKKNYRYSGGWSLDIDDAYMTHQGHDLETKIRAKIVQLNALNQNLNSSILRVMRDYPGIIPTDIEILLNGILNKT